MKKKFYFSQDTKITTWVTQHFYVNAETEAEALEMVERFKTEDVATSDMSEYIFDTEYKSETHELLEVHENDYKPTVELYNTHGVMLGDNMCQIAPDDDFLFAKFFELLKGTYIPRDENFEVNLHQTAIRMFQENVAQMEKLYPALQNEFHDGKKWHEILEESVVDTYKLKLRLITPFEDAIHKLTKRMILEEAAKNNEKPFGTVIDYLKDMYALPKTEGWPIAEKILAHFGIDNQKY